MGKLKMHHITDILFYTKKLKEAGEDEKVAEAHAEMLAKLVEENIATKTDIQVLDHKIDVLTEKISGKFARLSWLGGILLVAAGAILLKLFHMW